MATKKTKGKRPPAVPGNGNATTFDQRLEALAKFIGQLGERMERHAGRLMSGWAVSAGRLMSASSDWD